MNPIPFKCLHSGKCCSFVYVQINLSIGDVLRLSDFLKKTIADLFKEEIIGFMPFFDTEDAYDVELGLIKPCKLHVNNRCSVYHARPLNCRIFPYFIIANFNNLSNIFNSDYQCVHRIKLNEELREKYKIYSKKIGNIVLEEAEMTKKLFDQMGFHLSFKRSDFDYEFNLSKEEIEDLRVKFFIQKIKDANLKSYENKISNLAKKFRKKVYSLEQLNEIEELVK